MKFVSQSWTILKRTIDIRKMLLCTLCFIALAVTSGTVTGATLIPQQISDMSIGHFNAGVGVIDGELYVWTGGTTTTEMYDQSADSWIIQVSIPSATYGPAEFVLNGKIYSVSGEYGSSVYSYDPAADQWATLNSFPDGRVWDAEGVVCDGSAYILGGRKGYGRSYPYVYLYDEDSDSWTRKADMPYHVLMHGVVSYGGEIWVFGGVHFITESDRVWSNKVQVYNPGSDSWRYEADMPVTLNWVRGVVYEDSVWLFSDYEVTSGGFVQNNHVYQYNLDTGVWTTHDLTSYLYIGGNPLAIIGELVYITGLQDGIHHAYRISLLDGLPPVADAGDDQFVECEYQTLGPATVALDGTGSFDPSDDPLTYTWTGPFDESPANGPNPTVTLNPGCIGTYEITLIVDDGETYSEPDTVLITVEDTTLPVVVCSVDPTELWPRKNQMVLVDILIEASDNCTSIDGLNFLVEAASSQPDDTKDGEERFMGDVNGEDGYIAPVDVTDAFELVDGVFSGTITLRAECVGNNDRVYTITSGIMDASGNMQTSSCELVVLGNPGKGGPK